MKKRVLTFATIIAVLIFFGISTVASNPIISYKIDISDNYAKAMDLHNNSVGYHLGNQAIINEWSEEELLNQVINAANNGELKIGL